MNIEKENNKLATKKIIVNIDKVVPNSKNPNVVSDSVYHKIKETIKNTGLFDLA